MIFLFFFNSRQMSLPHRLHSCQMIEACALFVRHYKICQWSKIHLSIPIFSQMNIKKKNSLGKTVKKNKVQV